MLDSFKNSLTKITDLTILFASIFTFLAFITPKEISIEPLERANENISFSQSELRSTIEALSKNQEKIDSIQRSINQLNSRLSGLDPELDSAQLEDLAKEIDLATLNLVREQSATNDFEQDIASLEASIDAEQAKIKSFEDRLQSSKSISWVQPVRNNVEALANAAGMDGILAGFAALIFCLVCKRRKDWFKKIFRIFYK